MKFSKKRVGRSLMDNDILLAMLTPDERRAPEGVGGNRFTSSLGYWSYRRLFVSTSFAGLANWTLLVARGWLAFQLTGSSTWVGVVTFAGFLPFVFGPVGGVLADRYQRKLLAAFSTALGSALSLMLAALTIAGVLQPWALALITVAMSLPRAAELPARQALIANVVPPEELLNAVSLSSVATFGTRALGPAIVIPLIGSLGAGGVFCLAAAFYLIATVSVLTVRASASEPAPAQAGAAGDLIDGLAYVIRTPSVAALISLVMFHCSLTMSFDSLLPAFAVQQIDAGAETFSVLAMCVGAGALVATVLTSGVRSEHGQARVLFTTAVLSGITPMAMALPMMSLPVGAVSTFAMGASQGSFMALTGALVQVAAPDALRGRVSSIYLLFAGGLMAWVNLINGALADVWDVPLLFLGPAALYLVILAAMFALHRPLRVVLLKGTMATEPIAVS